MNFFKKKFFSKWGNHSIQKHFDTTLRLVEWGDFEAAIKLLSGCVEQAPHVAALHFHLADIYRRNGQQNEAAVFFTKYLTMEPEDALGAAIKLHLMGKGEMPGTLPPAFIKSLFDQFAPHFEENLITRLRYCVPELMAECVLGRKNKFHRLLDLGCGTGLSTEPFRAYVDAAEGIDLSPVMIEIAREKKIFDELHQAEIARFLQNPPHQYDLIIAADLFIYLGAMENIFKALRDGMTPDALFVFSVQKAAGDGMTLGEDHRYSHGVAYVERCAQDAGLRILECRPTALRMDGEQPANGYIYLCAKA